MGKMYRLGIETENKVVGGNRAVILRVCAFDAIKMIKTLE